LGDVRPRLAANFTSGFIITIFCMTTRMHLLRTSLNECHFDSIKII
jgi:hypothetical protein